MKIVKWINENKAIVLVVLLGLVLRIYKGEELFYYNHDTDLLGWFVKEVATQKSWRLIGQQTSIQGIFIGPFFYYLATIFYLIFDYDPIGGVVMITLIAIFTIFSLYYVIEKIVDKNTGLIASFIYATSYYLVSVDREVVPTTLFFLWSVWFLYSLNLLLIEKQKEGFLLVGFLIDLIWHINLSLLIVVPLVFVAQLMSKKRLKIRNTFPGIIVLIATSIPLFLFEVRNGFQQVNSLLHSLGANEGRLSGEFSKIDRVVMLAAKNTNALLWGDVLPVSHIYSFVLLTVVLLGLVFIEKRRKISALLLFWILLFIIFFSVNGLILSEYYLNSLTIVWISVVGFALGSLVKKRRLNVVILLSIFFVVNVYRVFTVKVNRSGYKERRAIISEIKKDANRNNYSCVSVSYITSPGNELGYRYLFWLEKMHVNDSIGGAPVYSIVFPHDRVDKIDKAFGALGLIYPEYVRYSEEGVENSCSGQNSNLTNPMFGYF